MLYAASGTAESISAQDTVKIVRPVSAFYCFDIGSARLTNTYLSPLTYSGTDLAFHYDRTQAMRFNPEQWVMRLNTGLTLDHTENPARNAEMWRLVCDFSWGMTHRWLLPHNIAVGLGGSTGTNLGVIYNPRNGNNPVAVVADWTLNLTAHASWRTSVLGRRLTLTYRPTLPSLGVFFSPDYGELFYEIYLGNHSGLAHFAWWGNYFRLENLLTADIQLGGTALRLGLRNNISSTCVNHITTRLITWSAVIGIGGEWMSINPYHGPSVDARVISATY